MNDVSEIAKCSDIRVTFGDWIDSLLWWWWIRVPVLTLCTTAAQITHDGHDFTQQWCPQSCAHLAQSIPGGKKGLINSCVFADILLSHADRHTQINVCIKYSLKCLFWQEDSQANTHTRAHTRTHMNTDPQAAISPAPQEFPPSSHLAVGAN